MKTRTKSQIRSHAQKYMIKLCKLYDIPIKSKKKKRFNKKDLNFPYGRKKKFEIKSIDNMSQEELKYLQEFNFYLKDFDGFFDQYIEKKNIPKQSKVNSPLEDVYIKQISDYIKSELTNLINSNNELFRYFICNDL